MIKVAYFSTGIWYTFRLALTEKLHQMENYERFKLISELEEKYNDVFENAGIENLEVVEKAKKGRG